MGRLVWAGVADYGDIMGWRYSAQHLWEMHELLDLKDKIDSRMAKASAGV